MKNEKKIRVLFLTRHQSLGASSRYRSIQHFDYLKEEKIEVVHKYFFPDTYLMRKYSGKSTAIAIISAYFRRIFDYLSEHRRADVIFIEKEILPLAPACLENFLFRNRTPRIYDYDDAIWESYKQKKIPFLKNILRRKFEKILQQAAYVCVGSHQLKSQIVTWGVTKIDLVPTTVSSLRYKGQGIGREKEYDIVWIGSMSTACQIEDIFDVLDRLHLEYGWRTLLIGPKHSHFKSKLPEHITLSEWTEQTELDLIASAKVGIMPLHDNPFERGKCGFKLIQYMGAGLPTVASAVGENNFIVIDGETGFLAKTKEDWQKYLKTILTDKNTESNLSVKGYNRFLQEYSTEQASKKILDMIKKVHERQ